MFPLDAAPLLQNNHQSVSRVSKKKRERERNRERDESNVPSLVKSPRAEGIVPAKALKKRTRLLSSTNSPNRFDSVPRRLLTPRFKKVMDFAKSNNSTGMVPPNRLSPRSSMVRLLENKVEGTLMPTKGLKLVMRRPNGVEDIGLCSSYHPHGASKPQQTQRERQQKGK